MKSQKSTFRDFKYDGMKEINILVLFGWVILMKREIDVYS